MRKREIWKEYPLNYEFENQTKVEVSNLGRIRTYNSYFPEGKIAKGSTQEGYPVLRLKLFKSRSAVDAEKLQTLQSQIDELGAMIKSLGTKNDVLEKKKELRAQRDELIQKRKKQNHRIDKKRTIHVTIMFHKAVATLFLETPTDPDKKFVIHKDFDKTNNEVENLAWASREDLKERYPNKPKVILAKFKKQFMTDDYKPNTKMGKLTENEVLRIKQRLKKGDSLRTLAKQYGVSDMQIHRIKTGENWSHVKTVDDLTQEKENKNKDIKKWQAT